MPSSCCSRRSPALYLETEVVRPPFIAIERRARDACLARLEVRAPGFRSLGKSVSVSARVGLPRLRSRGSWGQPAETRSTVVVMGALARSGLKRLLIGNTAERVLDRPPSDLLVIQAEGVSRQGAATPPRGALPEPPVRCAFLLTG